MENSEGITETSQELWERLLRPVDPDRRGRNVAGGGEKNGEKEVEGGLEAGPSRWGEGTF